MTLFVGFAIGVSGCSSCRSVSMARLKSGGKVRRRVKVDPAPVHESGCETRDYQNERHDTAPAAKRRS